MLPLLENIFLMSKFRYQLMKLSQKIDEAHQLLVSCQDHKIFIEPSYFTKSFIIHRINFVVIGEFKIKTLLDYLVTIDFVKIRLNRSSFNNL
jgi:hypothetical protein